MSDSSVVRAFRVKKQCERSIGSASASRGVAQERVLSFCCVASGVGSVGRWNHGFRDRLNYEGKDASVKVMALTD